jgi:hypothetical protein
MATVSLSEVSTKKHATWKTHVSGIKKILQMDSYSFLRESTGLETEALADW